MLVTGDISELWEYRRPGKWVVLEDGTNEVSIFHKDVELPPIDKLHEYHKTYFGSHTAIEPLIPVEWNTEDAVIPGMKLLHFTALKWQPWFYLHPDADVRGLYEEYRIECGR